MVPSVQYILGYFGKKKSLPVSFLCLAPINVKCCHSVARSWCDNMHLVAPKRNCIKSSFVSQEM